MQRAVRVAAALALVAAIGGPVVGAQVRPARALAAPTAEFEEPLTGPLRMIELRDGRVLIHDGGETRLAIADFASGEFTDVAREGSGPAEFRSAMALLRAVGDSIWLYDLILSRVLVLGPDGKPVRTQLFANASDPMAMLSRPIVREHDAAGRTFGELRIVRFAEGRMSFSDSVLLVRATGGRTDTVAMMPNHVRAPSFDGQVLRISAPGFPSADAWGVFPDGRVMVVRGVNYVPEIFLPNGTRRTAAALPFPRVPVTAADRTKMMDDTRKAMEEGMNLGRAMAGNQPMPRFEVIEPDPWQSHKPPLAGTVVLVDPRDRAWVPVLRREVGLGERFDLLDADGKWLDAVTLPKDVTLIGFGRNVVYSTRKDSDDLLWLQRHPLP
jgi:hypothetical protein